MSKKRAPTESSNRGSKNNDKQAPTDSDCELMQGFEQEDNTKRAKLVSLSDTTLQDLPIELLECILVKVVAMEVRAMKLAKSVWKAKADLVINRLRTVSLQWSSILSTNIFINELHRTLDGTAQETIRLETLPQPSIQRFIMKLTTMKDEVFMICQGISVLHVYDRNNMGEAKEIIPLGLNSLRDLVACNVSNCVYILSVEMDGTSITRIAKDEHQFKVSVWIKHLSLPSYGVGPISLSANGSLIILSRQESPEPTVVGIYDANGFVQHEIRLFPAVYGFKYVSSVIQRSNGNLLLVGGNDRHEAKLLEIEKNGRIIREYQSSFDSYCVQVFEDIYGRILVNHPWGRIEVFDSEFNLVDSVVPRLFGSEPKSPFQMHYNRERHEMLGFYFDWNTNDDALVSICLTDE